MMVVFVAVLFGSYLYRAKINPQPAPSAAAPAAAPQAPAQPPAAAPPATAAQPAVAVRNPAAPVAPVVQAGAEKTTVVENDLYRITFSNRGAQVTSWILKHFKDDQGKPLELVHSQAAKEFGYPLSLYTSDASLAAKLNQALFVPSVTGQVSAPATLKFTYSDGSVQATKTFVFDATYVLQAEVEASRGGAAVPVYLSWPGGFGDQNEVSNGSAYSNSQVDYYRNGSFANIDPKKVNSGETIGGPFDFAGVADMFFAAVFLPDSPAGTSMVTLHNQLDVSKTIKRVGFGSSSPPTKPLDEPILGVALGSSSGPTQARIFVGPKAISVLKKIHAADSRVTLEPMLEFGFWGFIGKYLFLALQFVYTHITSGWSGAWGWAIIVLTVLINVLILPFRVKTMQSALKMQRIQPQMDAIKEKYKKYKVTDPKRNEMQKEVAALYKEHGVNPIGGCLPLIIQMPFLFAYYRMLGVAIDLRHAPWLWVHDLAAPDPTHVLPIAIVVTMFLMQRMTPQAGMDPSQQKMMNIMMPGMMGVISWNLPAGLGLYWSVGQLIGIVQQSVMNRTSLGREMREMMEKRARKKEK